MALLLADAQLHWGLRLRTALSPAAPAACSLHTAPPAPAFLVQMLEAVDECADKSSMDAAALHEARLGLLSCWMSCSDGLAEMGSWGRVMGWAELH